MFEEQWAVLDGGGVRMVRPDEVTFVGRCGLRETARMDASSPRPEAFAGAVRSIFRGLPAGEDGGVFVGGILVAVHESGSARVFVDAAAAAGVVR